MKIDDSMKKLGLPVAGAQTRAGKTAEKSAVDKAPTDNVTLSPKAQAMATKAAGTNGVFDSAKVTEIKAAIAKGTFVVNPERVADGLIDTVKDLISTRKGSA